LDFTADVCLQTITSILLFEPSCRCFGCKQVDCTFNEETHNSFMLADYEVAFIPQDNTKSIVQSENSSASKNIPALYFVVFIRINRAGYNLWSLKSSPSTFSVRCFSSTSYGHLKYVLKIKWFSS